MVDNSDSGNDFIRGLETRACVNGMTKSDVERLKNALVKKILDDETVIDVTEDGSIIADSNGMFISVNGQVLGLSVDGENIIPVTEPYLPEDENENPLAPPNDTIMTSANIAVDPRIVHTTGNETISGNKTFNGVITFTNIKYGNAGSVVNVDECCKFYELTPNLYGSGAEIKVYDNFNLSNSLLARFVFSIGGSPLFNMAGKKVEMVGYKVILAKRVVDEVIEIWIKNIGTSTKAINCELRYIRTNAPIPNVMKGNEPVVGDVYSQVVEVTT